MYDYLIVGSGLFGAVFAFEATKRDKKCLVIEKRGHIGGNVFTEKIEGINVHQYGAHIFHTNDLAVWRYINQFTDFIRNINEPHKQNYKLLPEDSIALAGIMEKFLNTRKHL